MSRELYEYLAIPYIAVNYSIEKNGSWIHIAEYPELPGCRCEASTALDALNALNERRVVMLMELHRRDELPPRPRPPLKSGLATHGPIDVERMIEARV